jgi:hypothetical protein
LLFFSVFGSALILSCYFLSSLSLENMQLPLDQMPPELLTPLVECHERLQPQEEEESNTPPV